jgi:hypothetical protein
MAANGIVIVEKEDSEHVKVGAWSTGDDGMITVAYLGSFPSKTTQLGGHLAHPEALARLMLSEFK